MKPLILKVIQTNWLKIVLIVSLVSMFVMLSFPVYAVQALEGEQQLVPATTLICVGCGGNTPTGTQSVNCDSTFDYQCTGITDDLGNEVKVWCINKSFYACLYIPKNGKQRFVGRCPFGGGRNSISLYVIPDKNNNGKLDHIQGTVWISHDGPAPVELGGYNDDDNDGKYDRWRYVYNALTDSVKQDNLECNDYYAPACPIAKTETKKPKEDCFKYDDLQPNPHSSNEESIIVSTHMVFPANAVVRERFILKLAHAEIVVQPEGEMMIGDFLKLLVAKITDNCYLNRTIGISPEYQTDEQQQQTVTIKCVDPQELAIIEADRSLQRLSPVRNLQANYDMNSGQVNINWDPGDEYDMIVIWRNGNRITDYYSGKMNSFTDDFKSSPLDILRQKKLYGVYTYTVFGIRDGVHSIAKDVQVNVVPERISTIRHGISFALGMALPSVTFEGLRKPGINLIIDYHLKFHENLLFYGMVGFNKLSRAGDLEGTHWWNLSFNLRYYPGSDKDVRPYFGFGPGYYRKKGEEKLRFGYNLSTGISWNITSSLDLEIGGDYHRIFIAGNDNVKFLHFHTGIIFKL